MFVSVDHDGVDVHGAAFDATRSLNFGPWNKNDRMIHARLRDLEQGPVSLESLAWIDMKRLADLPCLPPAPIP